MIQEGDEEHDIDRSSNMYLGAISKSLAVIVKILTEGNED